MKIKLLACLLFVAIMSSCTDENQITPKGKESTLKAPEHLYGLSNGKLATKETILK
jgi:hypothetical protein